MTLFLLNSSTLKRWERPAIPVLIFTVGSIRSPSRRCKLWPSSCAPTRTLSNFTSPSIPTHSCCSFRTPTPLSRSQTTLSWWGLTRKSITHANYGWITNRKWKNITFLWRFVIHVCIHLIPTKFVHMQRIKFDQFPPSCTCGRSA